MLPVPEFSSAVRAKYLLLIGMVEDRMLSLIDIETHVRYRDGFISNTTH